MKRLNASALMHPTTQDRILSGLIVASENAKQSPEHRGHVYISNAKGMPLFRLDVIAKPGEPVEVAAYRGNIHMSSTLADAMGLPLAELL